MLGGYLRLFTWRIQVDGKGVWPSLQRASRPTKKPSPFATGTPNTPPQPSVASRPTTSKHVATCATCFYRHLRQEERTFRGSD
ncbi:MAG: hypothetical protein R2856_23365 [Caldilineaceae bacterium]